MSQQFSRLDPPSALAAIGRPISPSPSSLLAWRTSFVRRRPLTLFGPNYEVISVLPWLPAIPWLGYLFGAVLILCAIGLLLPRTLRSAALLLGTLLFVCTVVLEAPKYAVALGSIPLRTGVLEPLSLACIAWLLPGPAAHSALARTRKPLASRREHDRLRYRPLPRPHLHRQLDPHGSRSTSSGSRSLVVL